MIANIAKRYPSIGVITARMVHDALHGKGIIKLTPFERVIIGLPNWVKWAIINRIIQGTSTVKG